MKQLFTEQFCPSPIIAVFMMTLVLASDAGAARRVDLLRNDVKLLQTGQDNGLVPTKGLFRIRTKKGRQVLSTESQLVNIHAHFQNKPAAKARSYTYSGQMAVTEVDGGVGVTFHSQYPEEDRYYRLRRYADNDFHVAPHGTEITSGETATGVTPKAKRWYRFKIVVSASAKKTRIRAKVWLSRRKEPRRWQVDCTDSSDTRIRSGKFGVWSMANGRKLWTDLEAEIR